MFVNHRMYLYYVRFSVDQACNISEKIKIVKFII